MTTKVRISVTMKSKPQMMAIDSADDELLKLPEHKLNGIIKTGLMRAMPDILVIYGSEAKLRISKEDIEVRLHEYGNRDVNPLDVSINIRIGAREQSSHQSQADRDRLHNLVADWFRREGAQPVHYDVEVGWEPTYGADVVKGVPTKWCP